MVERAWRRPPRRARAARRAAARRRRRSRARAAPDRCRRRASGTMPWSYSSCTSASTSACVNSSESTSGASSARLMFHSRWPQPIAPAIEDGHAQPASRQIGAVDERQPAAGEHDVEVDVRAAIGPAVADVAVARSAKPRSSASSARSVSADSRCACAETRSHRQSYRRTSARSASSAGPGASARVGRPASRAPPRGEDAPAARRHQPAACRGSET